MIKMTLAHIPYEIGHCQITYYSQNASGERIVHCLQHDFGNIRVMRCSQDGEPSHEVTLSPQLNIVWERPVIGPNDSKYAIELKTKVNEWIDAWASVR